MASGSNEKQQVKATLAEGDIDVHCRNECIVKTVAFRNFDALYQFKKKGDVIRTNLLSSSLFDGFTLFLDLYPQGDSQATEGHASVYVSYSGAGDLLLKYSVKMRAEKKDGTKINTVTSSNELECWRLLTTDEDGWGWKNFVDATRVSKADTLYLDLHVSICHTDFKPEHIMPATDAASENALANDFTELLKSGTRSDVDLIVGEDRKRISCHTCVLAARSPVFDAMFNSNMKEGQGAPVVIPDTDKDTLDLFLGFVYSGKLAPNLCLDTYLNLLDLGAKYSVTTLVDCVGTQLCSLLTTDNVVQLLRVADRHNLPPLKTRAVNLATRDALTLSLVQKNPDFETLDADCMRALLGAAAPPQRDEPPSKKQRTN